MMFISLSQSSQSLNATYLAASKISMMSFCRDFHEHSNFVKSVNATFLVLIPKMGSVEDLRDFRPISLVGGFVQVVASGVSQ